MAILNNKELSKIEMIALAITMSQRVCEITLNITTSAVKIKENSPI